MSKIASREIRLVSRPKGIPTVDNFTLTQTELAPLQDPQVLVRNLYMSVDSYMRGRMNDGKSYAPPFELGKPLEGGLVGEVIESRAMEFKPGDAVTSNFGWRDRTLRRKKYWQDGGRVGSIAGFLMSKETGFSHPISIPPPTVVEGFDSLSELALDLRWSWSHCADDL